MNNAYFIIALLKCPGIGPVKALKYIVSNDISLEKCYSNIDSIVSKENFKLYLEEAEKEVSLNKDKNINIITIFDEKFPSKLYTISDPILYLYYYGNISLLNESSVAIIGTRHPSEEAISKTKIVTKEIAYKYVIIGGLALGIDSVAHQESIDNNGRTIAVLPAGIDNIQPTSNRELAKNIIGCSGLLVSEYSIGTKIAQFNYAKRDRIQAALANVIVVPEANEKSGTMIAVNKAYKEGKKVYQIQGNDNKKIKDIISIDKDYMKNIDESVLYDKLLENNKIKKIFILNNNKQISLL